MFPTIVLACYAASAAWLASSAYRMTERAAEGRRIAGLALGAIAIALHAVLLWRTVAVRPSMGLAVTESLSLIGWLMAPIGLVLCFLKPRFVALGGVIAAGSGLAALAGAERADGFALEHQSWELAAHVILSTVAYAVLSISVLLAIALGLLDRRLRTRKPLGWLTILPSVEALEAGVFHSLGTGFALLTLSLFSGFMFIEDLFAQHLIHKTVLSCLAWVVFAILLFGRWRFGWRGRTATQWTLSGFALLALAYFGSKIVLESVLGKHWG